MSDSVFLTGASGFVGAHVLRELLANGYAVRALVRDPATSLPAGVARVVGDLERPGDLTAAMRGVRYVVHCAALYSFAPRDRARMQRVNVAGTAGVLEAARVACVERVVLTSSSATLGHARAGRLATEADYAPHDLRDAYHQSKLEQERAAFAGRVPVVAILPTAPVGAGDWKPTPTGKMIRDFVAGRMIAKPPGHGGMNVVAVEDVARAHVAALTRGRIGERYAIGGENLSLDAIWELLAAHSGIPAPKHRAPYALALAVAYGDNLRCRLDKRAQPFAPLEGVRMARARMFVDDTKARTELAHVPTSVSAALARAVAWYRGNPRTSS